MAGGEGQRERDCRDRPSAPSPTFFTPGVGSAVRDEGLAQVRAAGGDKQPVLH